LATQAVVLGGIAVIMTVGAYGGLWSAAKMATEALFGVAAGGLALALVASVTRIRLPRAGVNP
jgi:Co/Zn/Cd efflux system component